MELLKKMVVVVALFVICHIGLEYWRQPHMLHKYNTINPRRTNASKLTKRYKILYYNPSPFISKNRKYAMSCRFEPCKWNNCDLSLNKEDVNISDALIFDGIFMPERINFTRPLGQIWVFAAQESPLKYNNGRNWWYKNQNYSFNWTMTYNINNTDIFLPYGEIRKYKHVVEKDFISIALRKNKTLIMIASNCQTQSKRQEYVKKLKKYIDVDILGACGKKWDCGLHYRHDDHCFKMLNSYKFYLAFENAFCHQYFSEKFFENYNYDTVMITRGGSKGEAKRLFPKGSFISTEDFKSIEQLGHYLKNMTFMEYVELLERKSQYYSAGYRAVYQRALCNLCEKMNFQKKYGKVIKDIKEWAFNPLPCLRANEVRDIR